MHAVRRLTLLGAACVAALLAVPAAASAELGATIRRTSHGIPHIKASTIEGAAYGYGYALAEDNICVVADAYVTVRGERSRFFGPDARWTNHGNGATQNNLNSDFFFQRIIDTRKIEGLLAQAPPLGPSDDIKQAITGYVAGYNEYLRRTGVDRLPDPACRGKAWVKPIEEIDAYRRFYQLALLASGAVAVDGIGGAQPPTPPVTGNAARTPSGAQQATMAASLKDRLPLGAIGSNAYGLGRDATDNGRGMVLGNPHFPWQGSERLYQAHLRVPGKLNVTGASLLGVPIILIGHNDRLAWSHTVSTAFRFTPFELKLVPGSPTTYLVDGQPREMTRDRVTVMARAEDGSLAPRSRTLYSTVYGPVFDDLLNQPLFPWTPVLAYAMGDANAENFRYLNHFFEKNQAHSVSELDEILRRNQGIPWVNTIAADADGNAYYADIGAVPNVEDDKAARCNNGALGQVTDTLIGLPILDGAQSSCGYGSAEGAVAPGILPPRRMPSLRRSDYVANGNDSYWLTNPMEVLEGFPRIIGDERTQRTQRTRLGIRIIQQRLDGSDGLPGKRFTLRQLQDAVFNNRQHAGELWRDDLVAYCEANPQILGVDVREACPALRGWDLRDDLDSKGAVLFRRFASRLGGAVPGVGGLVPTPGIDRVPFDPADPVNTPRGLNTANPAVGKALSEAVTDLRGASLAMDAPLRGVQFARRGDEEIPIHGGPGGLGVFNAISAPWVPGKGFPDVRHGSSFVMAAQFTDGCPEARSILTYSQSTNRESPFFADQTRLYSRKQWVKMRFCERDVAADTKSTTRLGSDAICRSRRVLTSRLRLRRGERIRSVRVSIDGRRSRAFRRAGRRGVRVSLRGLRKGTHRVRITARTSRGRTIRVTRVARTCVPRSRPSRG
jgi:acyl-homoserine-lactone acylase